MFSGSTLSTTLILDVTYELKSYNSQHYIEVCGEI